jgi:hypothetical protein
MAEEYLTAVLRIPALTLTPGVGMLANTRNQHRLSH